MLSAGPRVRLVMGTEALLLCVVGTATCSWTHGYAIAPPARRGRAPAGNYPAGYDWPRVPSTWGEQAARNGGHWPDFPSRRTSAWGTQWGQLNRSRSTPRASGTRPAAGRASARSYHSVALESASFGGLPSPLGGWIKDSYLVDSASSHMLVSKIKPCMSKYKQLYRETANGSLNQL